MKRLIIRSLLTLTSLAVSLMTLPQSHAADYALVDFNPSLQAYLRTSGGFTIGSKLTIGASNIIINSLGAQFLNSTSLQVGLWQSNGTLITSATVTSTNTLYNNYRYAALGSNFTLNANTDYYIGAYLPSGDTFWDGNDNTGIDYNTAPYSGNTGLTLTKEQYDVGASLAFPSTTDNAPTSIPGRWGPANAAFITPVPEPSTWVFGTISVSFAALFARKRRKSSAIING